MNEHNNKNLGFAIEDVDSCNTCITNHVAEHNKDYIRKGIIFVVMILTLIILL